MQVDNSDGDDDEDSGDDNDMRPEHAENNVEHQPDDADSAAQSASVDPDDEDDDGAVDGPPVLSYVDLARKVGMYSYQGNFSSAFLIKRCSTNTICR